MSDRSNNISFKQIIDITGGGLGVIDAPCPVCGPDRRSALNQSRKVFRVWCDTARFLTYRCARCEIEGYACDSGAGDHRPDPVAIEQAKAKARERQRLEAIDSQRKSRWLWSCRQPIAGSIAETYLRECRGYRGNLPVTLGFLPARGEHGPAMIAAFGMALETEPGQIIIDPVAVRGVHLTKLKSDGSGKAGTDRDKVMIGKSIGTPIMLAPVNDLLGLSISEGIEDALSVYEATGLGTWAAGSASRLPALARVVPDYIECVTIVADADSAGTTNAQKLADALAQRQFEVRVIVPQDRRAA
jgi:Toprim domain